MNFLLIFRGSNFFLQPVTEIGQYLRELNASRSSFKILFHTDAAQAIGKLPVNVDELGVDFLSIVGHKVKKISPFQFSNRRFIGKF